MTNSYCIDQVYPLTDSILQIFIKPYANTKPIAYESGQYVTLTTSDGQAAPYSIANASLGGAALELHIRHLPATPFSAQLLDDIKHLGQISLSDAQGLVTLNKIKPQAAKPVLFLAGGTGFAPIKALIEQLLAEGTHTPIYLYWGARKKNDLYLHEKACQWDAHVDDFHYIPVLSENEETSGWSGRTGLVHEAVLQDFDDLSNYTVVAAGPIAMVNAAKIAFMRIGLAQTAMYSDIFAFQS